MNVLAKNLEILLLHHDLVMVPGLGGFVVDYKQAQFDENENDLLLPPARFVIFNRDLNVNDGLLVSAYMQNFDANYPQAYRQMELDVEELYNQLDIKGWVCLENVGTLRKDLEGRLFFEQIHNSTITPALFALPPIHVLSVAQLQNKEDISSNIQNTAVLPIAENQDNTERTLIRRRRWRDIGISSAAAVALFFMFAFPYLKNNHESDKIIAGAAVAQTQEVTDNMKQENMPEAKDVVSDNNNNTQQVVQPQIIVLQTPAAGQNAIVISQQDINNSATVNSENGKFSIVVTPAANEECAQYVIDEWLQHNVPVAFYNDNDTSKVVLYSIFHARAEAMKALNALKPINKRFRKSWIFEMK